MSWNDFYRRRDILESVIDYARSGPRGHLPFGEIAGAQEEFGTEENLLLALHHKWSQLLTGRLRAELSAAGDGDRADAVTRAWQRANETQPELQAIIATYVDTVAALRAMHETDLRMLAIAAGLAEPDEPVEEITRVGEAFFALITASEAPRARRRNPMEQLRRLLAPAG